MTYGLPEKLDLQVQQMDCHPPAVGMVYSDFYVSTMRMARPPVDSCEAELRLAAGSLANSFVMMDGS